MLNQQSRHNSIHSLSAFGSKSLFILAASWLLFLLLISLFLGGCRRPPAPPILRAGWVNSRQLLTLHPNYPMLTELQAHYAALEEQRLALMQPADITIPTDKASLPYEAVAALANPKTAVEPEQLQAEFLSQLLIAKRRSLERRYERDLEIFQQSLLEAEYQERARLWAEAENSSRQALLRVEDKYQEKITAAFLSQEATYEVLQRQLARGTKVDERYVNYRDARKRYESLLRKQAAEKAAVARTLANNKNDIERNARQTTLVIMQQQQRQLENDKARDYRTLENQLFMQLALEAKQYIIPTLNFPTEKAGEDVFTVTGMPAQVLAGNLHRNSENNKAVAKIERVQQQLRKEERLQKAQIERDLHQLAVSLADKHGYRVKFNTASGTNLTASMRKWLLRYWRVTR